MQANYSTEVATQNTFNQQHGGAGARAGGGRRRLDSLALDLLSDTRVPPPALPLSRGFNIPCFNASIRTEQLPIIIIGNTCKYARRSYNVLEYQYPTSTIVIY